MAVIENTTPARQSEVVPEPGRSARPGAVHELVCVGCGYRIRRSHPPVQCPMCHSRDWQAVDVRGDPPAADPADRGLLATLLELDRTAGVPATVAAIAAAVGIPDEYADIIEDRLEHNRRLGYVECDSRGHWHPTRAGLAAVTSPADA